MSDLGKKLKEARESQGLSISEVSLSTKIGARMLKALEEGNFKILPALPFAKGFVRSYSAYLKLDPDQMVQLFLEEKGEGLAPAPISTSETDSLSNSDPAVTVERSVEVEEALATTPSRVLESGSPWNRVMIISGVVVLILAVVGIKNLVEKYKREGVVSESSGSNVVPIEKEEAANGAAELQVANPGEAKLQTANPQEAPEQTAEVEKPQPVQDSVSEQKQESSEPAPASTPPVEKAAAKAPEPTPAETTPSPVPSAQKPKAESVATPPPSSSEPSPSSDVATKATKEILLEALDKVRVNIRVGEESQSLQLQAGQVHMVRTSQKVVLDLSDGGAVNLVVNGRSRGVPGSLGEPKKVRLP